MLSVCRDLLQQDPTLVDIWLIVANLYAANKEVKATEQVRISCTLKHFVTFLRQIQTVQVKFRPNKMLHLFWVFAACQLGLQ